MASIPFSAPAVEALKNQARDFFRDCKSSHLTEAIASALGFRSYAALLAELAKSNPDPLYRLLDEDRFNERIEELGYPCDPSFYFEEIQTAEMLKTVCPYAYKIEYKSPRERVWRNLVVCVVNEALRQKLISLRPGDNRWSGASDRKSKVFDFVLPSGHAARGSIHDASFDELEFHIAVNPKGDSVKASNAGLSAGDAFALTWLERQNGAWIQSTKQLNCRQSLIDSLANIQVEPLGYGDRGRLIM